MDDTTKGKLLVLTDLPHSRARVERLGYVAEATNVEDVFETVWRYRNDGQRRNDDLMVVPLLNEMAIKDVEAACDEVRLPIIRLNDSLVKQALMNDDEDEGDELLGMLLNDASEQYEERTKVLHHNILSKVHIYSAEGIAAEIANGSYVREPVPTGIKAIDDLLDGGLPLGGVVTIGAMSSAGKTSLVDQIGNNMAERGIPFLFATLEQSRYELVSMALCRIVGRDGYDYSNREDMHPRPIDSLGKVTVRNEDGTVESERKADRYLTRSWIQKGPRSWPFQLETQIRLASEKYAAYADKYLHYMECDDQPTVDEILAAAKEVEGIHGVAPIVAIDYLQLLKAKDNRRDERLVVNDNMSALRRMARDLKTTVIVISALNRSSLSQGVTLTSFRESGGVEYACDVAVALQPATIAETLKDKKKTGPDGIKTTDLNDLIDKFRDADVKECDLRILKNRGGSVPSHGARLFFDGRASYFFDDFDIKAHGDEPPMECYETHGDPRIQVGAKL